jgi:hypothetical protein
MSIRDAKRIAALEARVSELVTRLEQLELAHVVKVSDDERRPRAGAPLRKGRQ